MINQFKVQLDENRNPLLIKERAYKLSSKNIYNSPKAIVDLCNQIFEADKNAEEHLYMIGFSTKCHVLGVFEVSHGTINASLISPREVFQKALLCGAASFALVHNHPSGESEASSQDIEATKRVKEAGELMNVTLTDHIIIGSEGRYNSLRALGYI